MDPKTHSCAGGEFAELAGREEHPSIEARKKIVAAKVAIRINGKLFGRYATTPKPSL